MEELHLQINFMLNNLVIRHEISTRSQYILCTLSTGLIKKPSSCTGKSLSEALIFASTNSQYDDRLFIELQVQSMKITS
jgi:hypothetical protein